MSAHGSPHGSPRPRESSQASQHGSSRRETGAGDGGDQGSRVASPRPGVGQQEPLGYDPAKLKSAGEMVLEEREKMRRRYATLDLTPEAYNKDLKTKFMKRPPKGPFNTVGKDIKIQVNQFTLYKMGRPIVCQYRVEMIPEPRTASFYAKVFNSLGAAEVLDKFPHSWVHDGRQLAWSINDIGDKPLKIKIDMDKEKGLKPREGPDGKKIENTVQLLIAKTSVLQMQNLERYLNGKMEWDETILESMNCLDHVLRMGPTTRGMLKIRRNFYDPKVELKMFDDMVGAKKGIYAAFTMNGSMLHNGGMGLAVNVDVANTTFWGPNNMANLMMAVVRAKMKQHRNEIPEKFNDLWRPRWVHARQGGYVRDPNDPEVIVVEPSEEFRQLRLLNRVQFIVKHRNKDTGKGEKIHKLGRFVFSQKYGRTGATSDSVTFSLKGEEISIRDYFNDRYCINLRHPHFPVIETSRAGFFPPEVCMMAPDQRYNFKLTPDQTSAMIKFAVTRPNQRKADIMKNVELLKWDKDEWLRDFGVRITPQMTITSAKLLPNPHIRFANEDLNPGVAGRWDLRNKKFAEANPSPLLRWSIMSLSPRVRLDALTRFMNSFKTIYRGHGGQVGQDAFCHVYPLKQDLAALAKKMYDDTKDRYGGQAPQIIFVVLPDKTQANYDRLKKSFDCRFALVTQMLQDAHVQKCQGQYISNVCMKVNAKLGGCTARAVLPKQPVNACSFRTPTMILGVDVTHPPVGSTEQTSVAAITMSMDKEAVKYMAKCHPNGDRVELLSMGVVDETLFNMFKIWNQRLGCLPRHIYYLRDGVAHSMFGDLLEKEIESIKQLFTKRGSQPPAFTVIVAQKRHHIRFFPKPGDRDSADRNGNALPGTLVERDVTHPHHFDFFLSSHSAIQGTARPTHYHVLLDEAGVPVNEIQRILYHHCYQYVRSTTPVSIHPAIYYAHLASRRAAAHEDLDHSKKYKSEERRYYEKNVTMRKQDPDYFIKQEEPTQRLLAMGCGDSDPSNVRHIQSTMWYV